MADATSPNTGLLLVLSGPSGAGKTSIARALIASLDARFSVSATTRAKGDGEVEGRDYFFKAKDEFERMIEAGAFLEYARVYERDFYGTPRTPVEEALARGEVVILDIDVQGALQVHEAMPDALMIFIEPPTEDEMLRRLRARARDDHAAIERRFSEAKKEIDTARASGAYDLFIVNEDLNRAIDVVKALIAARRSASRGAAAPGTRGNPGPASRGE